jgi:HK97 family phage major capsid protein/HK97 family phage prohead protease
MKRKIERSRPLYRTVTFDKSAVDDTARTVRLSISSDEPYLRRDFFGDDYYEILDHSPAGIKTDRLAAGTALLFNHNKSQHLGRNLSFENDGHKITVVSKFSRSANAEERFKDVLDGILVDASVGYQVLDAEELDKTIDGVPCYKVQWEVLEHSLVTVPADFSVGVGRSNTPAFINQRQKHMETPETETADINQRQENGRTAEQEKERIREIHAIGKRGAPADEIEKAIENNISANGFRKYVFENYYGKATPLNTPSNDGWAEGRRGGNRMGDPNSVGAQIVAHRQFQELLRGGKKTISFELPGISSIRSLGNSDFGGTIEHLGAPVFANQRLTIADLLTGGATSSGSVRYPRENSFTPGATTVGEADQKPEQAIDVSPVDMPARKVAAWVRMSQELLADAPAAQAYLNSRLTFAVLRKEEEQILFGDGLGNNMKGIFSTTGVQTQAKGADSAIDCLRKAFGNIGINSVF